MGDEFDYPPKDLSTPYFSRRLKLDQFLPFPPPPSTLVKKKSGEVRVLASAEVLLELDKKEEELVELKEQQKQERLEKAAAWASKKAPHAASVPKPGLKKGQEISFLDGLVVTPNCYTNYPHLLKTTK